MSDIYSMSQDAETWLDEWGKNFDPETRLRVLKAGLDGSLSNGFVLIKAIPISGNRQRIFVKSIEYEPLHKSTAEHIRALAPRLTLEEIAEQAKRPLEVIRVL